jgi:signal transduction histidine kinase
MRGLDTASVRVELAVAWAALAVSVLAVYIAVVLGGGLVIGQTEEPHLGLSVLATVIVAAGFEPARIRLERLAGRLLHRGRPAPYEVLARFSRQFAPARPAEQVTDQMARVLAEGTAAEWAQIWLLVRGRLTLVATHPVGAGSEAPTPTLALASDTDPRLRSVRVGHGGHVLGLLRVKEHDDQPLTPVGERLFAGLASQAGMVLHGAQLQAELSARLEELSQKERQLRHHRQKLVTSQELERRRLERDLHDGAQQELVALTINLRLAKTLLPTAPEQVAQLLRDQAVAADSAIDTLTRLSGGVHPRALTDGGLPAALTAAAAVSPIPVELQVADVGRFPPALEAAVYFCALEALQNIAKHSGATSVGLQLDELDGDLLLRVADNGGGVFTGSGEGTGLTSMRARVASVGGTLTVVPRPGEGTTVLASVPAVRHAEEGSGAHA